VNWFPVLAKGIHLQSAEFADILSMGFAKPAKSGAILFFPVNREFGRTIERRKPEVMYSAVA
jgi:hypothetical protein